MLELASSAAKLLGGSHDATPIAVTACAMASPLLIPALPANASAAPSDSTVTCSIDARSGYLRVTTAAATAVQQGVHMTAQLQAPAAGRPQQAEGGLPAAVPPPAAPLRAMTDLLSAVAAPVGKLRKDQVVTASIDASCQVNSGYDVHPAVADAAIHSAAAARAAGDVAFMVSTAVGAYSAPELMVCDTARGAAANVAVALGAPDPDGTTTSGHGLAGSRAPAADGGAILGVQARLVAPQQAAPQAAGAPAAAPPRASAWAVLRRPDFELDFKDSEASAAAAMAAAGVERAQLTETRPLPSEELVSSFRCSNLSHTFARSCHGIFVHSIKLQVLWFVESCSTTACTEYYDFEVHRSLPLRNELPVGIEPAVATFDEWMPLLVLRACLVLGLFSEPGASATPQQLAQKIIPEYRRFTSEMTAMLQRAGACPAYVPYPECDVGECRAEAPTNGAQSHAALLV